MSNKIVWTGVAVGSLLALGVMTTYFVALGSFSHQADSWAAFGSVLSAAFTLLATFATLATLITVLNQQKAQADINQKQAEINEEQLKATRFQQYINHRSLFKERLTDLEKDLVKPFQFHSLDVLYEKLFPMNSPFYFSYHANSGSDKTDSIDDLSNTIDSLVEKVIKHLLGNYSNDLAFTIFEVADKLHLVYRGPKLIGNLIFRQIDTGVNIYKPEEAVKAIENAFNNLASFTGKNRKKDIYLGVSSRVIRDFFISEYNSVSKRNDLLADKTGYGIADLESIFLLSDSIRDEKNVRALPRTYEYLEELFNSCEKIQLYKDANNLDSTVKYLRKETVALKKQWGQKGIESEELELVLEHWERADRTVQLYIAMMSVAME